MEDNKKRNKNKKKKNKQNKIAEDSAKAVVDNVTSAGENHVARNGQGGTTTDAENVEVQDQLVSVVGRDQERHFPNESETASLEDRIRHLLEERDRNQLKEANLLEKIKHVENEKVKHIHKEALLEEQYLQLQKDKDMSMQKEVNLEQNIAELQQENEFLMQKEARLEEIVKQREGEIESWLQKENSNKETVDFLNGDISRLQMQVAKLEQLRDNLLQEKQLMAQTISGLETHILNLETAALSSSTDGKMHTVENGHLTSEIEAAYVLIEKLITENADLVEKMDALYAELKYNGGQKLENRADSSSGTIESASVGVSSDVSLLMDEEEVETQDSGPSANKAGTMNFGSGEITKMGEHDDKGATEHREIVPNSLDASDLDEIVQISLDENESQTTDTEGVYEDEKTEVPMSDAPLIGAPFRLISFMARYVSGADLVEKNSVSGG